MKLRMIIVGVEIWLVAVEGDRQTFLYRIGFVDQMRHCQRYDGSIWN